MVGKSRLTYGLTLETEMKNARIKIPHFGFVLFDLEIFVETVTSFSFFMLKEIWASISRGMVRAERLCVATFRPCNADACFTVFRGHCLLFSSSLSAKYI